jgi:ABC-2 type transport system ATP-binding protein
MEPIISIKDLKMRYDNFSENILKGINLQVYQGQIIGYIGPNGAGKSTTVKILLGLLDNYEGSIKVFGTDI